MNIQSGIFTGFSCVEFKRWFSTVRSLANDTGVFYLEQVRKIRQSIHRTFMRNSENGLDRV